MDEQTAGMRHAPFFAELSTLGDDDRSWRAVSAGLVTLRLIDAWVAEGAAVVAADAWGVRAVGAAIEEMPEGLSTRAILGSVFAALRESRGGDLHLVAPRLMAYARSLELDAKWELAGDVYETIISHAHPVEESDVVIVAHLRLAFCQRSLGALDEASRSYQLAGSIAGEVDDIFGMLRARIGAAKISLERGNLPRAERLLDDVIGEVAARGDLPEIHAVALQDRAAVAFHRGRYDHAVELAYASFALTEDPVNRDRLLSDIALTFTKLGVYSAARDAYLIVEATAQEQFQRWAASLNLMELAAHEGAMSVFERYRRSLAALPFPPSQRVQYHLQAAEGYEALGDPRAALDAGHRARALAAQFGFHQLVFHADALVRRVEQGRTRRQAVPARAVDAGVHAVAESIGNLRREVVET